MGLFSIANAKTGSEEVISDPIDGILCQNGYPDLVTALKKFREDKKYVENAVIVAKKRTFELFDMEKNFQRIWDVVVN
jgi:hypothetical protein